MLSVQRTTQKFDARQICEGRVYSYFLPTSIIGIELDGTASSLLAPPLPPAPNCRSDSDSETACTFAIAAPRLAAFSCGREDSVERLTA